MKKRLLVIFSILIVVAIIVVLGSTVFTLQTAEILLYSEEGNQILDTSGVDATELISDFKGKNIFFLPESEIIDSIHSKQEYSSWKVIEIEKLFPNGMILKLTKRLSIFFLSKGGVNYAVDVDGYVIGLIQGDASRYIDISRFADSANDVTIASTLTWKTDAAEQDFEIIKSMTKTIWELTYNYDQIYTLLDSYQIAGGVLTLNTQTGAEIVIIDANINLHDKLISAYGVYSNTSIDMTGSGVIITVYGDGSIKTTNNN